MYTALDPISLQPVLTSSS